MNPATRPGPETRVRGARGGLRPVHFLVAANLVPLWGVFFWEWRVFEVAVLYWLENLVGGAFAIAMLGSPLPLLLLLIGGKTMLDIRFHRRSHRKLARTPA